MTLCLCLLLAGRASAQWTVIDPSNIAQSIVNTSKNVVHTSTTAQNMIKNFQETVKIYEQGKKSVTLCHQYVVFGFEVGRADVFRAVRVLAEMTEQVYGVTPH